MLMLLFYAGDDLYALDSSQVVEAIPVVKLRKVHHAPDYVAGLFNYRGKIVPVIDLCHLIQGKPSRSHLSTRIIMVSYRSQENIDYCLGLMAERVTETLNRSNAEVAEAGIQVGDAPYLGEMILNDQGMIQCIHLEHLLSDAQHTYLLSGEAAGIDEFTSN